MALQLNSNASHVMNRRSRVASPSLPQVTASQQHERMANPISALAQHILQATGTGLVKSRMTSSNYSISRGYASHPSPSKAHFSAVLPSFTDRKAASKVRNSIAVTALALTTVFVLTAVLRTRSALRGSARLFQPVDSQRGGSKTGERVELEMLQELANDARDEGVYGRVNDKEDVYVGTMAHTVRHEGVDHHENVHSGEVHLHRRHEDRRVASSFLAVKQFGRHPLPKDSRFAADSFAERAVRRRRAFGGQSAESFQRTNEYRSAGHHPTATGDGEVYGQS